MGQVASSTSHSIARTVLIVERSVPPKTRLEQQNKWDQRSSHGISRYCDIDTQGNKALVMKQYLSDELVAEVDDILEMKVTHRRNLKRREKKLG